MDSLSLTSRVLDCPAFGSKYVLTSTSVKGETSLEYCKKLFGPPTLTFIGDVSGSMQPNMQTLRKSVLAMCDMAGVGSKIRVIIFDEKATTLVPYTVLENEEVLETTKNTIRKLLENSGKSTNLELALKELLDVSQQDSDPKDFTDSPQIAIFASDGMANIGRSSSADLVEYARSFKTYASQTLYTLGIISGIFSELNSELLKDMALDTGGSFQLTMNSEGISHCLGDALAHHYFVRFTQAKFKCTSSNGFPGDLCTHLPKSGGVLRADKPLHLVWNFPIEAEEPYTFFLDTKERDGQDFFGSLPSTPQKAEVSHMSTIFGCSLLVPALDKKVTREVLDQNIKKYKEFLKLNDAAELRDILHELEKCFCNFDSTQEQTAEGSFQSYAMGSGGGAEVSLQAEALRSTAVEATQAQDTSIRASQPTQFPSDFDSQQTVESESNKRQKM
jgi:hypothetical protein